MENQNGDNLAKKFGMNPYLYPGKLVWESENGNMVGKLIATRKRKTVFLIPREGSGFELSHLKPAKEMG